MHTDAHDEPAPYPADRSLDEVLGDLAQAGFTGTFDVDDEDGTCTCSSCGTASSPGSLRFETRRRIEGASDPADMTSVLGVVCPSCGGSAAIVCRFGPEASAGEADLLQAARGQIGADG